ncbi:hypothetical protein F5877DRAFT_82285 [Lentinula edodes]|nr:hypothetical protein F5877DRAFT_82285 [Lentinula edodes]
MPSHVMGDSSHRYISRTSLPNAPGTSEIYPSIVREGNENVENADNGNVVHVAAAGYECAQPPSPTASPIPPLSTSPSIFPPPSPPPFSILIENSQGSNGTGSLHCLITISRRSVSVNTEQKKHIPPQSDNLQALMNNPPYSVMTKSLMRSIRRGYMDFENLENIHDLETCEGRKPSDSSEPEEESSSIDGSDDNEDEDDPDHSDNSEISNSLGRIDKFLTFTSESKPLDALEFPQNEVDANIMILERTPENPHPQLYPP